jgi:hypothetical protein
VRESVDARLAIGGSVAAVLTVAAVVTLAGAGSHPGHPPVVRPGASSVGTGPVPTGRITGVLHEIGGPAPGRSPAVSGTVTAYRGRSDFSDPAATVVTDRQGLFRLTLPAGTYELGGAATGYESGARGSCVGGPVTVTAGAAATIEVICPVR